MLSDAEMYERMQKGWRGGLSDGTVCQTCGSTQKRAWFGLGRVLGCIQPKCWNYYMWRQLPVGVNPPPGLYGGPLKPPAPPAPPLARNV
jgi:hypothetical protein